MFSTGVWECLSSVYVDALHPYIYMCMCMCVYICMRLRVRVCVYLGRLVALFRQRQSNWKLKAAAAGTKIVKLNYVCVCVRVTVCVSVCVRVYKYVCEVVLNSHRLLDNKQCAAVAVPQELDKVFWPDASCDMGGGRGEGGGVAQWALGGTVRCGREPKLQSK